MTNVLILGVMLLLLLVALFMMLARILPTLIFIAILGYLAYWAWGRLTRKAPHA